MSSTTELVSAMAGPAAPGAYGSKKRGGSVAHCEPADVLSGLGGGARWPNSTPAFVGAEEEGEVAALVVGAPGLVRWSRKASQGTTALGDSSKRDEDNGGRGQHGGRRRARRRGGSGGGANQVVE